MTEPKARRPEPARGPARARRAGRAKLAVVNWIAVYPVITLVLWLAGPLLKGLPLYLQTLAISLVLVTLMNLAVMPLALRLFRKWLAPA
jgi:antibiotic biosynthesis monooxygenase (ABM) superfamily enzyme